METDTDICQEVGLVAFSLRLWKSLLEVKELW